MPTFFTRAVPLQELEIYGWGPLSSEALLFKKQGTEYSIHKRYKTGSLQHASSIQKDDNNNDWFCTENGIGYFRGGKFYTIDTNSFDSSIDHMTTDYQGNLWFTSSRLGLLKLSKTSFTNLYRQYNLESEVVNTVTKWQNKLYIGTDVGLQIIDEAAEKLCHNSLTKKLNGRRIRNLTVDTKNHLWIAISGDEGLLDVAPDFTVKEYNPQKGTISNRFRTITELHDGTIAATENTGIDFIKNGKVIHTLSENDGLENPQILCLVEQNDNTILAGSDGCGIVYIENYKIKKRITISDGLSSDVILRIVPLSNGYLIVTSNGLCYMDNDLTCRQLTHFPYSNNYDAMAAKDENTSQHSERVAEYSVQIAQKLGWEKDRCDKLYNIARLHDIGKIGADILKDFTLVQNVADGARYHHERYDGRGYVEGLSGEDIPINARIIGIADAFDAMTSNR